MGQWDGQFYQPDGAAIWTGHHNIRAAIGRYWQRKGVSSAGLKVVEGKVHCEFGSRRDDGVHQEAQDKVVPEGIPTLQQRGIAAVEDVAECLEFVAVWAIGGAKFPPEGQVGVGGERVGDGRKRKGQELIGKAE